MMLIALSYLLNVYVGLSKKTRGIMLHEEIPLASQKLAGT